jgi:hypothetical protein
MARADGGNGKTDKRAHIAETVALRAVWADLLGDETVAHYLLDDAMARSPEAVRGSLDPAQGSVVTRVTAIDESAADPQDAAMPVVAAGRADEPARPRGRDGLAAVAAIAISTPQEHAKEHERPAPWTADIVATARKGHDKPVTGKARGVPLRVLAPIALVLISFALAPFILHLTAKNDLTPERLALDARATELTLRATAPGSALGCLDAISGDTIETLCEKALFATPEAVAASLSYVAAELSLLADAIDYVRRGGPGYEIAVSKLRHAAETDRFGFVAHVLAQRDGCTSRQCSTFALLNDSRRVSTNLADGTFNQYVGRHSEGWPATATAPPDTAVVGGTSPAVNSAPSRTAVVEKTQRRELFFPSAASIPPINIMVAEPVLTRPDTPATAKAQAPPARRPAQPATPGRQPVNLNPPTP